MTKMERWLAYFANQLDDKEKEELSMSDTAIKSAMQAARIFLNNTEERRRYINREMAIMDYNSDQEKARAEGRAEGLLVAIHSLMAAQNLTAQEAMDTLNLPEETKKTLLPQI